MSAISDLAAFVTVWLLVIPGAGSLWGQIVAEERIFEPLRDWIEVNTGASLLTYLINCRTCLTCWFTSIIFLLAFIDLGAPSKDWMTVTGFLGDTVLWTFLVWMASIKVSLLLSK